MKILKKIGFYLVFAFVCIVGFAGLLVGILYSIILKECVIPLIANIAYVVTLLAVCSLTTIIAISTLVHYSIIGPIGIVAAIISATTLFYLGGILFDNERVVIGRIRWSILKPLEFLETLFEEVSEFLWGWIDDLLGSLRPEGVQKSLA